MCIIKREFTLKLFQKHRFDLLRIAAAAKQNNSEIDLKIVLYTILQHVFLTVAVS